MVDTSFNGSRPAFSPLQYTFSMQKSWPRARAKVEDVGSQHNLNQTTVHTLCSEPTMLKTTIVPNEMEKNGPNVITET